MPSGTYISVGGGNFLTSYTGGTSVGSSYLSPIGVPVTHTLLDREKCDRCSRHMTDKCKLCVSHSMFRKRRVKTTQPANERDMLIAKIKKGIRKLEIEELRETYLKIFTTINSRP